VRRDSGGFRMLPLITRPLADLIDSTEPAWPLVRGWLAEATNQVELISAERHRGEATLTALQVTTRSPLGAIALECAAILVDHAWLRLLGAGHPRMMGLREWNGLGGVVRPDPLLADALVVAHDALGGFFAVNGGAFEAGSPGEVFYFAPDSLRWENLETGYSGLVQWATTGDLSSFYEGSRWRGWQDEIASASGDQGMSIYPFLSAAGGPVSDRSRRLVPMTELWGLQWQLAGEQ
jgi:hypothetical protein